jgi:hypothetical protein
VDNTMKRWNGHAQQTSDNSAKFGTSQDKENIDDED